MGALTRSGQRASVAGDSQMAVSVGSLKGCDFFGDLCSYFLNYMEVGTHKKQLHMYF